MNVDALAILEDLEEDAAKDAIQLFTSPRNTCITHINNTFEVLSPPNKRLVALKGVTTSLKAYTWPHFTFSALSENVKYLPPELRGEKPPPGVGELDGVGINAGSRRGSRVHQEAEMFVHGHHDSVDYKNLKFHPLTNLVIDYILNPNSRRASVMSRESVDFGLGFDTWIPLGAEFKLYDEDCGIASAVDIVCINTNGTLCFIELKVGHAETWHASCGVMNGTGSSQVALTPLNQALVQVGIYGIIARHKYNVRNVRMVVLNVNYSGVREFCVTPDFLVQAVAPIYLDIKEAIRLEKEQRRVDREARKAERQRLRQYGRALGKKNRITALHDTSKRHFLQHSETLETLTPDELHNRINEIRRLFLDAPEGDSDVMKLRRLSRSVHMLWDIISSLCDLAPSVKIERARLGHIQGARVHIYNASIGQHLDAGDTQIDRTTLSPFSH